MRILVMTLAIALFPTILLADPQCCRSGEGSQHGCRCCAKPGSDATKPAEATKPARPAEATKPATLVKTTKPTRPLEATKPASLVETTKPVEAATSPQRGRGRAGRGMMSDDHNTIHRLLSQHQSITRIVEEIPGGVRTTTTTDQPELVATLRIHVRQMARRLEEGQPIRMWDPVFRDIFANADEITLKWKNVEGGIEVTETSEDSDVVPMIRAHAKAVNAFVAEGHAAARPPWAGGRRR